MLDIEEAGGTIDLFDAERALLSAVDIPAEGNNSATEVSIGQSGVATITVNLVGSDAVDDLVYSTDCPNADDTCDGQNDVTYIAGVPVLFEFGEDANKDEEQNEAGLEDSF